MSEEDFDLPSPRGQPVGANDSAESQIELVRSSVIHHQIWAREAQ